MFDLISLRFGMMTEPSTGHGKQFPYKTGKVVQNWARTFECHPERFYTPKSEDDVIHVLLPSPMVNPKFVTDLGVDREPCSATTKDDSGSWISAFAIRYPLYVRMDGVAGLFE